MKMKKSKMLTYSTCALLSAGLICGGIVYNNTTAESTKVAAIGLTNIDSGTKDIMKQVQEVITKKNAKKATPKAETSKKETKKETVEKEQQTNETAQAVENNEVNETQTQAPAKTQQSQPKQESTPSPSKKQEAPQPQQEAVTNPIAQTALSYVGANMWCEEVAEKSIEAVGKSAWITVEEEDGDAIVEHHIMEPDNFLQIASQVSLDNLQQGDLLYYANNGSGKSHIAVYVGNGQVVHGGYNGANVVIAGIYLPGASTPIGLRV